MPTADFLREHLRSATRGKRAATARNYADALRPVIDRLGPVPLQKLTTAHVEDLVDWMLTAGRRRGGRTRHRAVAADRATHQGTAHGPHLTTPERYIEVITRTVQQSAAA